MDVALNLERWDLLVLGQSYRARPEAFLRHALRQLRTQPGKGMSVLDKVLRSAAAAAANLPRGGKDVQGRTVRVYQDNEFDVVVVGSGLAGLTAAVTLVDR